MFDLKKLSSSEIEEKIKDIENKITKAYFMENMPLLEQLQTYHSIYVNELQDRMMEKKDTSDNSDNVIEVDPELAALSQSKKQYNTNKRIQKRFNRKKF